MADNKTPNTGDNVQILDGALFAKMANGGAAQLRANADTVNNLNVFPVPDGDTGDNMCMTIESGVSAMNGIESDDLSNVSQTLSKGMLLGARGNSGVILSQLFDGISTGLKNRSEADAQTVGEALKLGVKRAYESVMTPTEGTILTVARESVEYAVDKIDDASTVGTLFSDLLGEMKKSLSRTPELLPILKEAKVVDSGGAGLLYIIEGFCKALNGEEIFAPEKPVSPSALSVDFSSFNENSEMEYGYCTEFLLQLQNSKVDAENFEIDEIVNYLRAVGNSIVAFKTGTIVKVHVHTHTPGNVLEFCRKYGEFLTVKIENMSVQHNETITEEETEETETQTAAEKKKYATVAVCSGEGIAQAFYELGVDKVVWGGQTSNPSTQDFLDAFSQINAENIFVFPNNGNIILAAKQAASVYSEAEVYVIESKDLGKGFVGAATIDYEAQSAEDVICQVTEAMKNVTTGSISTAVRDAEMNGIKIMQDDYIGLMAKDIILSEKSLADASRIMADRLLSGGDISILTVFCGSGVDPLITEELSQYCADSYGDVEVYFVEGKQEVYPYIMVAEGI